MCNCLVTSLALVVLSPSSVGEPAPASEVVPQECGSARESVTRCVVDGGKCWEEISLLVECLAGNTGDFRVRGRRNGNSLALDFSRNREPIVSSLAFPVAVKGNNRIGNGEDSFFRVGRCIRAGATEGDNLDTVRWAVVLLGSRKSSRSRYYGFPNETCAGLKPVGEAYHPRYFSSKVTSYIDLGPVPTPRAQSTTNGPKEVKPN